MRPFPSDEELEAEVTRRPPTVAQAWALLACEAALEVWERHAAKLSMCYRDSVVGLEHVTDRSLPRRTLQALASGGGDLTALGKEWLEPITALQDDDWSLPDVARFAFYACFNALEAADGAPERFVTAVLFARHATFEDLEDDRARFDALWWRWWERCAGGVTTPDWLARTPDLRLTYASGAESAPGDPCGRNTLVLLADGSVELENRFHGKRRAFRARVAPEVVDRVLAALRAGGFPETPPHGIPAGSSLRTLHVKNGEGEGNTLPMPWHGAAAFPGYGDAFKLLDSIVRQASLHEIQATADFEPDLVSDAVELS